MLVQAGGLVVVRGCLDDDPSVLNENKQTLSLNKKKLPVCVNTDGPNSNK